MHHWGIWGIFVTITGIGVGAMIAGHINIGFLIAGVGIIWVIVAYTIMWIRDKHKKDEWPHLD